MRFKTKWIVFQLLEICNLRCKICYQWGDKGNYKSKKQLNTLSYDKIKSVLNSIEIDSSCMIGLFGGEPTLHPNFPEILKLTKEKGAKVYLDTNGTNLEKYCTDIVENKIDRIIVSNSGPQEVNDSIRGKGSYKKTIEGIKAINKACLKDNSTKIGINYTVDENNYQFIKETIHEFINEVNIDFVSIELINYMSDKDLCRYRNILKKEFNILKNESAQGLLRNISDFKSINASLISDQCKELKEICTNENVQLYTGPNNMSEQNISNYFKANWEALEGCTDKCYLPWMYVEVASNGDVTPCHTFYDLSIGNVNEMDINEILNGKQIYNIRKHLKNNLLPNCFACCRFYMYKNYLIPF